MNIEPHRRHALHRGLIPLGNAKPVKIEGSLVPHATTVWDFINRGMPWAGAP
jgi:hypothetical protein